MSRRAARDSAETRSSDDDLPQALGSGDSEGDAADTGRHHFPPPPSTSLHLSSPCRTSPALPTLPPFLLLCAPGLEDAVDSWMVSASICAVKGLAGDAVVQLYAQDPDGLLVRHLGSRHLRNSRAPYAVSRLAAFAR